MSNTLLPVVAAVLRQVSLIKKFPFRADSIM